MFVQWSQIQGEAFTPLKMHSLTAWVVQRACRGTGGRRSARGTFLERGMEAAGISSPQKTRKEWLFCTKEVVRP